MSDGGQDMAMSAEQYSAVRRGILELAHRRLGTTPGCLMCVLVSDRHINLEPRTAYLNDHPDLEFFVDDVVWKCPACATHFMAGYGMDRDEWHELLDLRGGRRWDAVRSLGSEQQAQSRLEALGYK